MDLSSLAILCFIVAGIAAVLFIIRQHKLSARVDRYNRIAQESRSSEMVISEVNTYKETKEQMAHFKAELDKLGDILETIAMVILDDEKEASEAYQSGLKKARGALVSTRNAAESLLALVEKRPPEKELDHEVFGSEDLDSIDLTNVSQSTRRQAEQLLDNIKRRIGDVRPCIAGFYFALTIPDDDLRVSEAAEQIRLVLKNIDDAILRTAALEKMLV